MGLENDLNLVALHQRQEEISENEMKAIVSGSAPCVENCHGMLEHLDSMSWAEESAECSCGSMWVIFGLWS